MEIPRVLIAWQNGPSLIAEGLIKLGPTLPAPSVRSIHLYIHPSMVLIPEGDDGNIMLKMDIKEVAINKTRQITRLTYNTFIDNLTTTIEAILEMKGSRCCRPG